MNGGGGALVFFCLATGAALGCLFLLFSAVQLAFHAGKLTCALLDVFYCCLCAAVVFLCALAVDHGRLRLLQAACQLLGGWAAVASLSPFVSGAAKRLRKIFCKVSAFFRRRCAFLTAHFRRRKPKPAKKRKKTGKRPKKAQKKT